MAKSKTNSQSQHKNPLKFPKTWAIYSNHCIWKWLSKKTKNRFDDFDSWN